MNALMPMWCKQVKEFSAVEDWDEFIKQAKVHYDGTLDPIHVHFMSISDMRQGQKNLKFMADMGKLLVAMNKLITDFESGK